MLHFQGWFPFFTKFSQKSFAPLWFMAQLHIESLSEVLVIYKWVSLPIPYTPFCPTVGIQVYLQVSARQLIQTIWAGTHDPTPTLPLLCGQDSWCLRKASLAGFLKTWSTQRKWLEYQKNAVPWHDTIHCAGQSQQDEKLWFAKNCLFSSFKGSEGMGGDGWMVIMS